MRDGAGGHGKDKESADWLLLKSARRGSVPELSDHFGALMRRLINEIVGPRTLDNRSYRTCADERLVVASFIIGAFT